MVYSLQFTVYRWLHWGAMIMVYSLQFKFLRPCGSKRQSRAYRWLHWGAMIMVYSLQMITVQAIRFVYSLKFIVYSLQFMVYGLQFMVYSLRFKFLRPCGSKRQSRAYRWLHAG